MVVYGSGLPSPAYSNPSLRTSSPHASLEGRRTGRLAYEGGAGVCVCVCVSCVLVGAYEVKVSSITMSLPGGLSRLCLCVCLVCNDEVSMSLRSHEVLGASLMRPQHNELEVS